MSDAEGLEREEPEGDCEIKLAKAKEELVKAETELEALRTESKALTQQVEYLKTKDFLAQGEKLKHKQALDDCNQKLVNAGMEQVQTHISQEQLAELEAEILARQKTLNNFEKKIRKLEERIKELGNEIEVAEKQIALLRTKYNKSDDKVTALELEREELQSQIDTQQEKLNRGTRAGENFHFLPWQ
jgi:chromosome segregation ATPase